MSVEKVARGYKTTCLMDFETSFGVAPDVAAGKLLPINSFGLNVSRAKNSSATLGGRRDPVEPYDGNTEVTGSLAVPVDAARFVLVETSFGSADQHRNRRSRRRAVHARVQAG